MARPKKELDLEKLRKLAQFHCTVDEIADILDVSRDTIYRHGKEALDAGRAQGKMNLRMNQLKAAQNGSAAMLIWLGKQMLGQKDQQEIIAVDEEEKRLTDEDVDNMLEKILGTTYEGSAG